MSHTSIHKGPDSQWPPEWLGAMPLGGAAASTRTDCDGHPITAKMRPASQRRRVPCTWEADSKTTGVLEVVAPWGADVPSAGIPFRCVQACLEARLTASLRPLVGSQVHKLFSRLLETLEVSEALLVTNNSLAERKERTSWLT